MAIFRVPNQSFRWLFAELTVVIMGILLAFQIEEWRNKRADQEIERALLENIATDIQSDLIVLKDYRDTLSEAVKASIRFREYLESGVLRDEETMMGNWIASRNPFNWRRTSPTYLGWQETDRPDLVSSTALRLQMYNYHNVLLTYLEERSLNYLTVREEFVEASYLDFEFPIVLDKVSGEPRRNPKPIFPLEEIPRNEAFITYLNRMGGASNDIRIILEAQPNIIQESEELVRQIQEYLDAL